MGKYSNPGMGAGQQIFDMGHIRGFDKAKRKKPSQKTRLRQLKLFVSEYGMWLRVGKLKNGKPLLYPMKDPMKFLDRFVEGLEQTNPTNKIAHDIFKKLNGSMLSQIYWKRKGCEPEGLWISIKQKDYLFRNLVQQGENKNGDDTGSQGQEKSSRSSEGV